MTQPGSGVQLAALPPERGRRTGLPPALYCGCSCCCCCLHTLGAGIGALAASRVSEAPSFSFEVSFGGATPEQGAAAPLPDSTRVALGSFAVYWAAERLRAQGELSPESFEALSEHVRERVMAVWKEAFRGRRAEAVTWMLERLPLMAEERVLPPYSLEHLQRILEGQRAAPDVTREFGLLAQLWKLHSLYLEVAAAVRAGAVPEASLPPVRRHLFATALRAASQVGAFQGGLDQGHFQGPVLEEARACTQELAALPGFAPADGQRLTQVVAGSAARVPEAVDGTCPVCADDLKAWPVVHCAACEALHHEGCWSYNGRCATFACGCLDTLEAPRSGGAPVRFDLSEGHSRETESRPDARATGVYWMCLLVLGVVSSVLWTPFVLLLAGPLVQLAASLVALVVVALVCGAGRGRALARIGAITGYTLLGAVIGSLAMMVLPMVLK